MKLTQNDLFLLCQCAISAAFQAGQLISTYTGKQLNIKSKPHGKSLASQIVTEVDMLSQELVLKTLLPTCHIYDLAILAEESTDNKSRFEKDYFWCIDPLDGTLPFTESKPGYAVSIALVKKDGAPQIGVVYDPVRKNLYHAIKEVGAFKNGEILKVNNSLDNRNNELSVFFDRSFFNGKFYEATKSQLQKLTNELGTNNLSISNVGGSVISAIQVIEQAQACYFKYPRPEDSGGSLWDYAATACIFNELKLGATDIFGHSLELNRKESTFMNHKGFIFASNNNLKEKIRLIYENLSCENE